MFKQWIADGKKFIKQLQSDRFWREQDKIIARFKLGKRLASFKRHRRGAKAGYARIGHVKAIKAANNNVRYQL